MNQHPEWNEACEATIAALEAEREAYRNQWLDRGRELEAYEADLARITAERNEALSLAHSRAMVIERVTEDWNAAMSAVRVCRSALWTVCNLPGDYDLNADKHQVTLTTGRAFALADSLLAIDAARKEGE